jgi:hypothetical protein
MDAYPDVTGDYVTLADLQTFNTLVDPDAGTTILEASKIPGTSGSPPRYLLLLLEQTGGVHTMATYDTFTDTYFSNTAAAATHYMLAYTWGVCDGQMTRGLVEITFSNDYSNQCQLPKTGLYYQSENQYFAVPYSCLGVAPDKLLVDCPEVAANMKALVASTCAASIPKVCQQQYELNPPFSCVGNTYASPLTVLSLAFSNTYLVASILALLVTTVLSRLHKNYRPNAFELSVFNPSAPPPSDRDDAAPPTLAAAAAAAAATTAAWTPPAPRWRRSTRRSPRSRTSPALSWGARRLTPGTTRPTPTATAARTCARTSSSCASSASSTLSAARPLSATSASATCATRPGMRSTATAA